jgi:colicin import membrane protein
MSKELAENQTQWDLHENKDILVPLEFTEEVNPKIFGLEVVKAKEMTSGLSVTIAERDILIESYKDVIQLEITTETLPVFKELRLKIRDNRTKGIQKWKEREKAFYLAGGNFIQAIYNKETEINESMETKLLEAEKFFENKQREVERLLNESRLEKLAPYVEDTTGLTFHEFSDEDFDDYVLGKKTKFENAKKEQEAEAKRLENERLENLDFHNRKIEIAPYLEFIDQPYELKGMSKESYYMLLHELKESKVNFDKRQKETDEENKRLKAKSEKLEAELKAKNEADVKVENERLAKVEADKKEADKLAKAPVKNQLNAWVDSFEISQTRIENETSALINEKFNSFKSWAKSEIAKI